MYINACIEMATLNIGSIDEIIEMPSSRWFSIMECVYKWQNRRK